MRSNSETHNTVNQQAPSRAAANPVSQGALPLVSLINLLLASLVILLIMNRSGLLN